LFKKNDGFFYTGVLLHKEIVTMKKYKWAFIAIAFLILTTAVVLNVSAKTTDSMGGDCVEDGSCCEDENTCSCG
jgi:hypothetical protein